MTWQETVVFLGGCLPREIGALLNQQHEDAVREIRIRAGGRAVLCTSEGESIGSVCYTPKQVAQMAEALCEHALYARAEEQKHGFVTLRGGHRMGLCGRVITQGQSVRALKEISSLCIRVAGQWKGAADALLPYLRDADGNICSVLLIGQPGTGKTTLLRDACRSLSMQGVRMGVVDERSEIAAMCAGEAQLDVGPHTDVLDGCCKEQGLRWMLRSMSPHVLVTDELSGAQDVQAVAEAACCGVSVMASLHGRDAESALSRGSLYQLVQNRIFTRYALLSANGVGRIACIYDEKLRPLTLEEAV